MFDFFISDSFWRQKEILPAILGRLPRSYHSRGSSADGRYVRVTKGTLTRFVFTWSGGEARRGPPAPGTSPSEPLRRCHRTAHSAAAAVVMTFNKAPSCGQPTLAVLHQVEKMTGFVSQLAGFFLLSTTSPSGAISSVISVKFHLLITCYKLECL